MFWDCATDPFLFPLKILYKCFGTDGANLIYLAYFDKFSNQLISNSNEPDPQTSVSTPASCTFFFLLANIP